jgi:hypothetical protein
MSRKPQPYVSVTNEGLVSIQIPSSYIGSERAVSNFNWDRTTYTLTLNLHDEAALKRTATFRDKRGMMFTAIKTQTRHMKPFLGYFFKIVQYNRGDHSISLKLEIARTITKRGQSVKTLVPAQSVDYDEVLKLSEPPIPSLFDLLGYIKQINSYQRATDRPLELSLDNGIISVKVEM